MLNISIETNTKLTQAEQTKYAQYEEREDRKAFLAELEKANQGSERAQPKKQDTNNNSASAHTQPQKHAVNSSEIENTLDKPSGTEQSIESKSVASSKYLKEVEKGHNAVVKEQVHSTYGESKAEQSQVETDTASGSFDPDTPVGLDTSSFPKKMPKELEDALKFYKPISPDLPKPISSDVPKALDEKLGLDDSNLPIGEDNGMFEQIQAAKKQTTDVQHNLAPEPKMLKDAFAQFSGSGETVETVNTDPKQDIAPPDLGSKKTDSVSDDPVVKTAPETIDIDKSRRPIDTVWPIMGKDEIAPAQTGQTQTMAEPEHGQSKPVLENKFAVSSMAAPYAEPKVSAETSTAPLEGKASKVASELESSFKHSQGNNAGSEQADKSQKGIDQIGPIKGEPVIATNSVTKPSMAQNGQINESLNDKVPSQTLASAKSITQDEHISKDMKPQSPDTLNEKSQQVAAQVNTQAKRDPQVKISAEGQVSAKLDAVQSQTTNAQSNEVISEKFVGKEQNVQPKALLNQVNNLSQDEKAQLKQSLQHAIDGGQLKPQQVKDAEQVLATLKEVEKAPEQSAKFTADKMTASNTGAQTSTSSFAKPEGADSYNSTKVTAQTLSESAQKNEHNVKVVAEHQKSAEQVKQMEPTQVSTKAPASAQVEQVFRSITQQPLPNVQADLHNVDLVQSTQQFDTAVQNAQSQQSVTGSQKAQLEANLAQPINIQRNDAVKALQEKVNMMLNINNKEAEIRLDPPELGSMQIRIRSEGAQAQVNFVVQNQQAKEALEQSMPKLKEMLAEQGIQLGESNIQQDNGSSNEQGFEQSQHTDNSRLANQDAPEQNSPQTNAKASSDGSGIDYYA